MVENKPNVFAVIHQSLDYVAMYCLCINIKFKPYIMFLRHVHVSKYSAVAIVALTLNCTPASCSVCLHADFCSSVEAPAAG